MAAQVLQQAGDRAVKNKEFYLAAQAYTQAHQYMPSRHELLEMCMAQVDALLSSSQYQEAQILESLLGTTKQLLPPRAGRIVGPISASNGSEPAGYMAQITETVSE